MVSIVKIKDRCEKNFNLNRLYTNFMDRISKLKEFLLQNPDDNFLQHALALEYVKLGNDSEAQKLFETILHRDPSYIGSYYHFAKLLERNGCKKPAANWYKKGMDIAKAANDQHAYNELKAALEEI